MSWNDASGRTPTGRRVRWIAIGAGAAALAWALVLATRQYNAHSPGESPPPTTGEQQNAAALAAARQASVGPATATMQNLVPGAIAPDVMGGALPTTGSASNTTAGRIGGAGAINSATGGTPTAGSYGPAGAPLVLGGSSGASGPGAVPYQSVPPAQGAVPIPILPYRGSASPPSFAPSAGAQGRTAAAGTGASPAAGGPR